MNRLVLILIICLNYQIVALGQSKEINATLHILKHNKEDSAFLSKIQNHNDYKVQFLRIKSGLLKDTAIFEVDNNSTLPLNRIMYNAYFQNSLFLPGSSKINKIEPKSKYYLQIPVLKDSSYVLVLSDFSNPVRIFQFTNKNNTASNKAELIRMIVDDSTLVRDYGKHPFKINSRLEQGETVKLVFILILGSYKNNKIKALLTTGNQDVYVKNKEFTIDSISQNDEVRVEYEISTSLTTDKRFPVLLRFTDGKIDLYNKEIYIEYNKNYGIDESGITGNTKNSQESVKAIFKNNTISLQFDLPKISFNNEYRYSYSIRDIKNNKIVYKQTNLTTVNKTEQLLHGFPMDNLVYNVDASVLKYNITPRNSYLTLNITPSSTSENIVLNNFKWGLRFLRVKQFGYYIELNSTLNSNRHDYIFDVDSKKVEGFDDYNKFYEFGRNYNVISRDAGAGLAYRLGNNLILCAGLSYYKYEFKQQIKEFEYADISKYSIKNVLIPFYSYSRVINKLSVNYNINKLLLGLTISDYNKNNYRVSFNIGAKI
jgi:hypothetical protein